MTAARRSGRDDDGRARAGSEREGRWCLVAGEDGTVGVRRERDALHRELLLAFVFDAHIAQRRRAHTDAAFVALLGCDDDLRLPRVLAVSLQRNHDLAIVRVGTIGVDHQGCGGLRDDGGHKRTVTVGPGTSTVAHRREVRAAA